MSKLILFVLLVSLSGCSQLVSKHSGQQTISSSLVDFLYPKKSQRVKHKEEIPVLKLPIRVGLAFLPSQNWRGSSLTETNKLKLLNKVKTSFGRHRFIQSISIIPSIYLRKRGNETSGFDILDQVARLHDVDVIALVSYDQVTQSLQNNASLLYWTIVGMYVIPGNENSIQTFVDTAIFDVKSRKMLLRAPGISHLKKRSTAIGVDSVMAKKSLQGFNLAFDDMIKNLEDELTRFRARVKEGHVVTIKHQQGYSSGGGLLDYSLIFLLGILILIRFIKATKSTETKTFKNRRGGYYD